MSSSPSDETPDANRTRRTPRKPRPTRSSRPRSEISRRSRSNRNHRSISSTRRPTTSSSPSTAVAQETTPFDPIQLTKEQNINLEAPVLDLVENKEEELSSSLKVITDSDHPVLQTHVQSCSLDDLFPSRTDLKFSYHFNSNKHFREDLKQAMRMDVFHGNPQNENLSDKVKDILLLPDSSLQGSWTQECTNCSGSSTYRTSLSMPRLTKVLSKYLGSNAPSGERLMSKLAHLCNPSEQKDNISPNKSPTTSSSYHWIDIIGIKNRKISHSWHQDTAILPYINDSIYTVMLGFPPEDNYHGTGVFSHVVPLRFPRIRPPLLNTENEICGFDGMAGEPVLYTSAIPEEYIIRPNYEPGKEILFYRDVDVLHSAPDVAYRCSVMRFMNIG